MSSFWIYNKIYCYILPGGLILNNSGRLKELDILRAIAFIFVVEQHTMGGYSNIKGISFMYFFSYNLIYS